MSRLIDADALRELFAETISAIAKRPEMNGNLEYMVRSSAMAIKMIDDQQTVDAVPVVRCKDCKWWDKVDNIDGVNYGTCERKCTAIRKNVFLNENWFCADGEKVTE